MTFRDLVDMFLEIGQRLIPLLGAVAFLMFVYGVGKFIRSAGNEKELNSSKNFIIWGIVGLFVLMTVWGLVSFLRSEFGFGSDVLIPQLRFRSGN